MFAAQNPGTPDRLERHDLDRNLTGRIHLDQAHRFFRVGLVEAEGQRRAGITNMVSADRLGAMKMPEGDIVRPVKSGGPDRLYAANPRQGPLAFADRTSGDEGVRDDDPPRAFRNLGAGGCDLRHQHILRRINGLALKALARRILVCERHRRDCDRAMLV